jgi:hypothetical protein
MRKHVRLTGKQKVDIVNRYKDNLERMQDLAKEYGITRQGVFKVIKRFGVETSKATTDNPISATNMEVSCSTCGIIFLRHRYRIRSRLHNFCSDACYHAFLEAGNGNPYLPNGYGGRLAREKVSAYFQLQSGHIVHHEDRNQLNNDLSNLRVFACAGDHVRYHRGFDVEPIWDGRNR